VNIRDRIIELRRVPADQLQPNPKNWRKHPESQANALRGVLAEVGIASAVLARETPEGGLMLIDGHLRTETLHNAEIPVLVLDVSEEEADKILATFDPLGAMAESDADALRALLEEVETGSQELADMLTALAEDEGILDGEDAAEIVEDEVPEPPVDPITKPGDLWILGDHRLLCGDSTKAEDVERLMVGQRADLLWADPPFGIAYTGHGASKDGRANKFAPIAGDDAPDPSWLPLCLPTGAIYLKTTWKVLHDWEASVAKLARLRAHIVWDRCSHSAGEVVGGYATQSEIILFASSDGHKTNRFDTDVWSIPRATTGAPEQRTGHPYESPVALPSRAIENSSQKGEVVYDPFLGSGTTLIAAEQLGRKCYGMEISPQYCDVIVKRWETLTGRQAERRGGR
jgi:DNA modification methylase